MYSIRKLAGLATALLMSVSTVAAADLVINSDQSGVAPKAAVEALVAGFAAANPDVNVILNNFDSEAYKGAIRNFLTANPPDVVAWMAGNRMTPFVEAGLFEDVTALWEQEGLNESLRSAASAMTIDGKKWGVPYTYYQWGIYYRKDIFAEHGIAVPTTWDELMAASQTLKAAEITPFAIGTKALWPAAGWFDNLNLRINGYQFHMDLTAGKVPYTDPRVRAVFEKWGELARMGGFLENHAALDWQDAYPQMVQGKAAMYLMGNFLVAPLKEAGLTDDNLGFFQFPEIVPGVPRAEDAPTNTYHIASGAKNKPDALRFLAYLAAPETQTMMNEILGQLPVNNQSKTADDPFQQAGFEMLSTADSLAQFYDRDAPAEMAKAGMEAFQEFMVKPDDLDRLLERLERVRQKVYQ